MDPSCAVRVAVEFVSIIIAAFGFGRDLFAFEKAASSSWSFLLNYRAILKPIASDSSASDIFLSILHITVLARCPSSRILRPLPPLVKSRFSRRLCT